MKRIGEPDEVEIIRAAIRARMADVRTALPGIVESYDATSQTCTVKLGVRIPDANGIPEELDPLTDVPVSWMRGGGYFASCPLEAGDEVLLVFCEADFSAWRESGEVSDAAQERRHGLYCYAIPGGCSDGKALADAASDHMVCGKDSGDLIRIKSTGIEIGRTAVAFAARADLTDANFTALQTWLSAHVHTSAAPGVPTSPPVVAPPSPTAVAASKVKVQ